MFKTTFKTSPIGVFWGVAYLKDCLSGITQGWQMVAAFLGARESIVGLDMAVTLQFP